MVSSIFSAGDPSLKLSRFENPYEFSDFVFYDPRAINHGHIRVHSGHSKIVFLIKPGIFIANKSLLEF